MPNFDELDQKFLGATRNCPHCKGTGFKVVHGADPLWPAHDKCACADEAMFKYRLAAGNIPPEFRHVDTIEFEWNTKVQEKVEKVDMRHSRSQGLGFLFVGLNGVGKSALAALWLIRAARAGFGIGFITAHDFVTNIIKAQDDAEFGDWFNGLLNSDFLVIDELGKEHRKGITSDYSQAALDSLFRDRRGAGLPTTVCSNHELNEIRTKYGESIWSLFSDRYQIVLFEDGDFRKNKPSRR